MGVAMLLVIAGCRSAVEDFYTPLAKARPDAGCMAGGSGGTGGNSGGEDAGGGSGGGCSP